MTHLLLTHLIAPGHTHRSLDAGVVDQRVASLRHDAKPAQLPHLRGMEALAKVSHAFAPLTQRGDAIFGTLRLQGEASDWGLCAPLRTATARAGLASRPVVIRVMTPVAQAVCKTLPPRLLGALHPDLPEAQAAAANLVSALMGTLPGQVMTLGVMPICWTTSQWWAATKLALLGPGYLAGFAAGQIEHNIKRVTCAQAQALPPVPCNAVTFALQTPIEQIPAADRFVTHDGRHVFDVAELAAWFAVGRTRRNVYTNAPFDAVDDRRLASFDYKALSDSLYGALRLRWDHFCLADLMTLMACAATLIVATEDAPAHYIEAAYRQIDGFIRGCTPAEVAALDALFAGTDGTPLTERLRCGRKSSRARRAAGAQMYAALGVPMLVLMWRLTPAALRGAKDAGRLLIGLIARDMAVHACLQAIDSEAPNHTALVIDAPALGHVLCDAHLWAKDA